MFLSVYHSYPLSLSISLSITLSLWINDPRTNMDGVNLGTEAGPILNMVLFGQCMGWDEGGQSKCGGGEGRLDGKGGLLRDSVTWGPDPKKAPAR